MLNHFSCVLPFGTLWTIAHQALLSMRFSRQEDWSGLPCPPAGDLPNPGIEPTSLMTPALAGGFFTTSTTWEAPIILYYYYYYCHKKAINDQRIKNTVYHADTQMPLYDLQYSLDAYGRVWALLLFQLKTRRVCFCGREPDILKMENWNGFQRKYSLQMKGRPEIELKN